MHSLRAIKGTDEDRLEDAFGLLLIFEDLIEVKTWIVG